MNTTPRPIETLQGESYQATRFNALRHGVLSRYTVLPWEDKAEYQTLLGALVAEHSPVGPTEEHLVEELAGIVWRKRRLRLAEAAVYRERIRKDAASNFEPEQIAGAALLPMIGKHKVEADIPRALTATSEETVRDLRDVKRDEAMTRKALNILVAGAPDTYSRALAALREDTRSYWMECLEDSPVDGLSYEPTAEALGAWIRRHWTKWYEWPIAELEHRESIREQAFGSAYATQRLEATARYEVHLDRKLERTLALLIRLRELRRPAPLPPSV
jgi:hypothetical protein